MRDKRGGTQCSEQQLILSLYLPVSFCLPLSLSLFLCVSIDVTFLCPPGSGQKAQGLLALTLAWRHSERS